MADPCRAEELVDFLQDVVYGTREATAEEVHDALAELEEWLPSLEPVVIDAPP